MTLGDAILFAEGAYQCELGAPWRWADLLMTKPYQTIAIEGVDERARAAAMINKLGSLKLQAGYKSHQKPKLFWRWADKMRDEYGEMVTRLYIDGNPGRDHTNPSKPSGRPTVGQIKLLEAA